MDLAQRAAADSADAEQAMRRTVAGGRRFPGAVLGADFRRESGASRRRPCATRIARRAGAGDIERRSAQTRSPAATHCNATCRRAVAGERCRSSSTAACSPSSRSTWVRCGTSAMPTGRWGDCYWWQNVRFPYHAMLASGDFEMMDPLVRDVRVVPPAVRGPVTLYRRRERLLLPGDGDHLGLLFQRGLRLEMPTPTAKSTACSTTTRDTSGTRGSNWSP